jgi:hypothetical protein
MRDFLPDHEVELLLRTRWGRAKGDALRRACEAFLRAHDVEFNDDACGVFWQRPGEATKILWLEVR